MPYINVITNISVTKEKKDSLAQILTQGIEVINGKKKESLYSKIDDNNSLYVAGDTTEPNAMVTIDFYNYVDSEGISKYCNLINEALEKELNISRNRTFISVTECRHWGTQKGCMTAFEV